MPEFPMKPASLVTTVANSPSTSGGTTLTNGALNTKGTYVELIAATTFDANWILVETANASVSLSAYNIDIAVGAATEQIILPDLHFNVPSGNGGGAYLFPVFIPAGSRISARSGGGGAASTCEIVVHLFSATNFAGGAQPTAAVMYGTGGSGTNGTNIDPGAVANTDSAWTQLTAATTRAHNWVCVGGRAGDGTLAATTKWLLDIGIGSATEQEIIADLLFSAGVAQDVPTNSVMCFPLSIPSGSRIAIRCRSNSITDGDRDMDMKIWAV